MARGKHLFPFRTEPLSPSAPMVLGPQGPGRVGRRRFLLSLDPADLRADRGVECVEAAATNCRVAGSRRGGWPARAALRGTPEWPRDGGLGGAGAELPAPL